MRFVSASAILAAALLASCSGGKSGPVGTSASAKQLVGHWSTRSNDHLYFGETDPATKIGSYIMVHPDGKDFIHRYKIESVEPSDRTIVTTSLFKSGESRETTYVMSEDGKSMESITMVTGIETHSLLTKEDDTTAP